MYVVVSKSKPNKVWRQKFGRDKHTMLLVFDTKKEARKAIKFHNKKGVKIVPYVEHSLDDKWYRNRRGYGNTTTG